MKAYNDTLKKFQKAVMSKIYSAKLSDETLEEMTYSMKQNFYEQDNIIFSAKDRVDCLFLILSGKAELYVEISGKEILFDTLHQGCIIGLYGILGEHYHTFTCKVMTNVHIYFITQDRLRRMINEFEDLEEVVKKTKSYIKNHGYPLIDYKIYYSLLKSSKKMRFKSAIWRLKRIKYAFEGEVFNFTYFRRQ